MSGYLEKKKKQESYQGLEAWKNEGPIDRESHLREPDWAFDFAYVESDLQANI